MKGLRKDCVVRFEVTFLYVDDNDSFADFDVLSLAQQCNEYTDGVRVVINDHDWLVVSFR